VVLYNVFSLQPPKGGCDKYLIINKSPLGDLGANNKRNLLREPRYKESNNL